MLQRHSLDLENDLDEILNRHPAVGLAVGVVTPDGIDQLHVHGVADIGTGEPIHADTVFRIASITKTFTAIAVMQLAEQGLIDLDAPANEYLRSYELVAAAPLTRKPTIRHLLTHTAGLPEVLRTRDAMRRGFGEGVPVGRSLPTLAEYYGGTLRTCAEPGTRFTYTNHGPATLGQIVADVSGEPFDRYLRSHVFAPLGMQTTDLVRSEAVRADLATGYEIGSRGVKRAADWEAITAGAASIYSTPRDMAHYLAALLGGGRNAGGAVVGSATLRTMFAAHYRPDSRIPGIGLGFFRSDLDGHVAVGHQGTLPGFHSQVTLAVDDGVAIMAFTNGGHHPELWLPSAVATLLRRLIGAGPDRVRRDVPPRPDLWGRLVGRYRLQARLSDMRVRSVLGGGLLVLVRRGRLMARFLTPIPGLARGFPLYPDDATDPYVFRIDLSHEGMGTLRIAFERDATGTPTRAHLDLMPLTLVKRSRAANDEPRTRRW